MALVFIVAGFIGLVVTVLALNSRPYRNLSDHYEQIEAEPVLEGTDGI
jgi:hypothetical protein